MIDTNTERYLRDNIPVPVVPKAKEKHHSRILLDLKTPIGRLFHWYRMDYIIKELRFRDQLKTVMFRKSGVYCSTFKSFHTGSFYGIQCGHCIGCLHKGQLVQMSESFDPNSFQKFMDCFEFNPYLNIKEETISNLEKEIRKSDRYSNICLDWVKDIAKKCMDQEIDRINKTGRKNDKH